MKKHRTENLAYLHYIICTHLHSKRFVKTAYIGMPRQQCPHSYNDMISVKTRNRKMSSDGVMKPGRD